MGQVLTLTGPLTKIKDGERQLDNLAGTGWVDYSLESVILGNRELPFHLQLNAGERASVFLCLQSLTASSGLLGQRRYDVGPLSKHALS